MSPPPFANHRQAGGGRPTSRPPLAETPRGRVERGRQSLGPEEGEVVLLLLWVVVAAGSTPLPENGGCPWALSPLAVVARLENEQKVCEGGLDARRDLWSGGEWLSRRVSQVFNVRDCTQVGGESVRGLWGVAHTFRELQQTTTTVVFMDRASEHGPANVEFFASV